MSRTPPAQPTVLTLDPAFFTGVTDIALRGWAKRTGRIKRINYGAIPLPGVVAAAVGQLDRALTSIPGRKFVLGWSEGAQIAAKWLRDKGPTSTLDPGAVTFVLIGNPERRYGGACVVPSPPSKLFGILKPKAAYGGCGVPADTRFRVVDFARQYGGWEDCPTVAQPSPLALSTISDAYHMQYFTVGLDDPSVVTHTEGNITWALHRTPLRRESERAAIEASYERPPYAPGGVKL